MLKSCLGPLWDIHIDKETRGKAFLEAFHFLKSSILHKHIRNCQNLHKRFIIEFGWLRMDANMKNMNKLNQVIWAARAKRARDLSSIYNLSKWAPLPDRSTWSPDQDWSQDFYLARFWQAQIRGTLLRCQPWGFVGWDRQWRVREAAVSGFQKIRKYRYHRRKMVLHRDKRLARQMGPHEGRTDADGDFRWRKFLCKFIKISLKARSEASCQRINQKQS